MTKRGKQASRKAAARKIGFLEVPCNHFVTALAQYLSPRTPMRVWLLHALICILCNGCAVVTVADAAVTVVATTVKVSVAVVGTAVDVAAAGAKAVAGSSDTK